MGLPAGGCGPDEAEPNAPAADGDMLLRGELFVPVSKGLDPIEQSDRSAALSDRGVRDLDPEGDIYLAVHGSVLTGTWFLSTYLKELHPFGPFPRSLGTRVVRLLIQNGELYVFDVDNRRATSDVFSPELILDAFPIVSDDRFDALPGASDYILIDPAAGLNRFSAEADAMGDTGAVGEGNTARLETELSFVQRFRGFDDGCSFEQIITAYSDVPLGEPGDVEKNDYRVAATLGISLREYKEGASYKKVTPPENDHYFLSEPAWVPNTGETSQVAVHWDIHPGMTPIKWLISPSLVELQKQPELANVDAVGAVKRGIESWNDVFGFPVFEAEVASDDVLFDEDRVNYFIVDPDVSKSYAYADWRTNPNTGEVRGASVYFGGAFFAPVTEDPAPSPAALPLPGEPDLPGLKFRWQDEQHTPLCVMWSPAHAMAGPSGEDGQSSEAEHRERMIQSTAAHEVGHTLGLRHNFKGSLMPPTSSVMEYSIPADAVVDPGPREYDVQAIRYLYGLSADLPTQPFCTDEDRVRDPDCALFDSGADPLVDSRIPQYSKIVSMLLSSDFPPELVDLLVRAAGAGVLGYVRSGTAAQAAKAWTAMLDGLRPPLDPSALSANPALGPRADAMTASVFRELYIAPIGAIQAAPSDSAVIEAIVADAQAVLLNVDGVRSGESRRVVIDALKGAQNLTAYQALLSARTELADQLSGGGLSAEELALTQDLIAHIDANISPYFK